MVNDDEEGKVIHLPFVKEAHAPDTFQITITLTPEAEKKFSEWRSLAGAQNDHELIMRALQWYGWYLEVEKKGVKLGIAEDGKYQAITFIF